jgi:hypothetical protein
VQDHASGEVGSGTKTLSHGMCDLGDQAISCQFRSYNAHMHMFNKHRLACIKTIGKTSFFFINMWIKTNNKLVGGPKDKFVGMINIII